MMNMEHQQQCKSLQQQGYFGKSVKPRKEQPSMFEILTWQQTQKIMPIQQKINHRIFSQKLTQNTETQANNNINDQSNHAKKQGENHKEIKSKNSNTIEKNQLKKNRTQLNWQRKNQKKNNKRSEQMKENACQTVSKQNRNHLKTNSQSQQQNKSFLKFKQTTRWLPNTSFTTYFGKPAFQAYGRANLYPLNGGVLYGNYMKSHNIQPHCGPNKPQNAQSYHNALDKAAKRGPINPCPPKSRPFEQYQPCLNNEQIYPQKNKYKQIDMIPPQIQKIQKFKGKILKK